MTEQHLITREIAIDAGHRVTHHGSKCRNLHGHRYRIEATCIGPLFTAGEQEGMVLDFGFLKEEMMNEIDVPCDHGMILWIEDPWVTQFVDPKSLPAFKQLVRNIGYAAVIRSDGQNNLGGKYYFIDYVPTAENLARHWYNRLAPKIKARTLDKASLLNVKVFETPNCSSQYPIREA